MTETPSLLGAARLRELLDRYGIRPTRTLGQNFVIDPNTIRKVVVVAGVEPGDRVLEIGAGAGSLTLGLLATGAEVIALEVDEKLVVLLRDVLGDQERLEVVAADALRYDLSTLRANKMVANLPYNVAATVVIRALETVPSLRTVTVMTQREVGERLAASPGSKVYGLTSVLTAFFGRAGVAAPVSRRAFYPVPKVDSVLVRIDRHAEGPSVDPFVFKRVAGAAFSQRRKMLRRCLVPLTGNLESATDLLRRARIPESARAEDVAPEKFITLAELIQNV